MSVENRPRWQQCLPIARLKPPSWSHTLVRSELERQGSRGSRHTDSTASTPRLPYHKNRENKQPAAKPKTVHGLERSLADPGDAVFFLPPAPAVTIFQAVHAVIRGVLGGVGGDGQPGHAARGAALIVERPVGGGRYLGRDQQHDVACGHDQSPGIERASRRTAAGEQAAEVVQEQVHRGVAPAAAAAAFVVAAAVESGPGLAADALGRGALAVATAVHQENPRGSQTAAAAAAAHLGLREVSGVVGWLCRAEGLIDLCKW